MKILLLIIVGVLVLASVYTLIRYKKSKDIWSWWDTFTSVVLSAAIGFGFAVVLFESQEQEKRDAKIESFKKSFALEILYIRSNFSHPSHSSTTLFIGKRKVKVWISHMPTAIFEDAARTGLFSGKDGRAVYALEAQTKSFNREVDHLRSLAALSVGNVEEYWPQFEGIIGRVEKFRKVILENCGYLESDFDLKIDTALLQQTNGIP